MAFLTDSNGNLKPLANQSVFSFFPTQEKTGLKFLIHAPFLLSENRKMIRWKESLNSTLINLLAEMTANAILYFKSLKILDDSILSVIPYDLQELSRITGKDKVAFRSFYNTIRSAFQKQNILPSTNKEYGLAQNAYWADNPQLPKLFKNDQLRLLLHNNQAFWAFPSLGASLVQSKNPELANFIRGIVKDTVTEKDLLRGRPNFNRSIHDTSFPGITPSFIEVQSIDWLSSFYLWLADSPSRWKLVRNKPVFLNGERKAISAFESDRQMVFPYGENGNLKVETIHSLLLKRVGTPCLLYRLGIRPHKFKEEFPPLDRLMQFFISQGYLENKIDFKYIKEDKSISWIEKEKPSIEKKKKNDFFRVPYDEIPNPYSSLPNKPAGIKDQKERLKDKKIFNPSKEKISSFNQPNISLSENKEELLNSIISDSNPNRTLFDSKSSNFTSPPLPKASSYPKETKTKKDVQKVDQFLDLFNSQEKASQEAQKFPKYSFGWITRLLAAEILSDRNHKDKTKKQLSSLWLRFDQAKREYNTKRTLILTEPKTKIPPTLKDLSKIPLTFHFPGTTKTIPIESAEIQEDRLRVKLQNIQDIQGLDLNDVKYVEMEDKPITFLTRALLEEILNFKYSDTFNFQKSLCDNIHFIFGPPGTGKTTHLAQNVLTPLMQQEKCKVLVLTPTNKAADVLTRKIMEIDQDQNFYENWLVRFGSTEDEEIENSAIFKGKSFNIQEVAKNVTITTIARLPYDKFYTSLSEEVLLTDVNWDYVVVDEASMISLAYMIYLFYKISPKKFIVAGDPFQIEPILNENSWKKENIYTMVHLNSFTHPKTTPYQYEITPLKVQYRSIPEVGQIFSQFTYEGKLENYRAINSQKALNLKDDLTIQPLNLIKFPVRAYDGLYKSRQLNRSSSYQIYSALFTFEFVSYLAQKIAQANPEDQFKIGIIGPYAAQMNLINKLVTTQKWPTQVKVQVGTVHGFQGDECDIIFAVLNIPSKSHRLEQAHISNQNILNVSISRARDYLFVLMPDEETENIENFEQLTFLKQLLRQSQNLQEWSAQELEAKIFKEEKYLENNTFFTSHQDVNVYSLPERRYEVRVESKAIDIQVHRVNRGSIKIRKPNSFSKVTKQPSDQPISFQAFSSKESLNFTELSNEQSILPVNRPFIEEKNDLELAQEKMLVKDFGLREETSQESLNELNLLTKTISGQKFEEKRIQLEDIEEWKKEKAENISVKSEFLEKIPIQDFSKKEELFHEDKNREKLAWKESILDSDSSFSNNFTNNEELTQIDELNQEEGLERLVEFTSVEEVTAVPTSSVEESATIGKYTEFGEFMDAMETILLKEQPAVIQEIVTHQERMRILLMAQKEELISLKKKLMATQSTSADQIIEEKPISEVMTLESSISQKSRDIFSSLESESAITQDMEAPTLQEKISMVSQTKEESILTKDTPILFEDVVSTNQFKFLMDHPLIPDTWVQNAKKVEVTGQKFGEYVLLPYTGNIETYTHHKPQNFLMIPSGLKKKISISVCVAEDLIFIPQDIFIAYKNELQNTSSVELKKKGLFATLFGKFKG